MTRFRTRTLQPVPRDAVLFLCLWHRDGSRFPAFVWVHLFALFDWERRLIFLPRTPTLVASAVGSCLRTSGDCHRAQTACASRAPGGGLWRLHACLFFRSAQETPPSATGRLWVPPVQTLPLQAAILLSPVQDNHIRKHLKAAALCRFQTRGTRTFRQPPAHRPFRLTTAPTTLPLFARETCFGDVPGISPE